MSSEKPTAQVSEESDVDVPTGEYVKEVEEANAQSISAMSTQQAYHPTVVDLSQLPGVQKSPGGGLVSYAIVDHQRNSESNPYRENTSTVATLVRRVNSEELLPRPFTSFCQLLSCSYLSLFCCCYLASKAISRAWKAKDMRQGGVSSSAAKEAKRAVFWLKLTLAAGICLYIEGVVLLVLYFCTDIFVD